MASSRRSELAVARHQVSLEQVEKRPLTTIRWLSCSDARKSIALHIGQCGTTSQITHSGHRRLDLRHATIEGCRRPRLNERRCGVPLYFFDVHDGNGFHRDEFGDDFDSFEEAREHAQALLPDIARTELPDGELHVIMCEVRDKTGRIVYRGKLTYEGTRPLPERVLANPVIFQSGEAAT